MPSSLASRRRFLKLTAGAAAGAPLAAPGLLRAQGTWPDKPVKVIVPFAAGGGTDVLARPWCEKLREAFGQQFVVENRGGASGLIGSEAAAKSPPDGYTFLFTGATTTVAMPLMRKINYDADALIPVGRMGDVVCGFMINPAVGPKTLPEVLDYAKKNPGKLAFASSGPGTTPHLRLELFKLKAGLDILHVPYRGGADAMTDVLANSAQLINEPAALPHCKAGKLHLFVVNHATRMRDFPDVPTMTESGFPGADVPIWFTLWAPGGTPQEIVRRLNAKIVEIAKTDDMIAKIRAAGCEPVYQTPEEIQAFREADRKALAEVIKVANIKLE